MVGDSVTSANTLSQFKVNVAAHLTLSDAAWFA